ncbi:MAG: hypothetical protein HKN20_05810 [Gemmatimonadetes bacterium]|nr:hypothetical protein [Gemmatimonadota bacterium]
MDPFQTVPYLDITIGKRVNNKVYRAEIERCDARNLILHVAGFDPLHFVDLLKGTPVCLRVPVNGSYSFARSKLAKHFKNSSPYVVVRRPDDLVPIVRSGRFLTEQRVEISYEPVVPAIVKAGAKEGGDSWGYLTLCGLPEPFDRGTSLRVSWHDGREREMTIVVCVAAIGRDPDDEDRYAASVRIDGLSDEQKDGLLRLLLAPGPEADDDRDEDED